MTAISVGEVRGGHVTAANLVAHIAIEHDISDKPVIAAFLPPSPLLLNRG